MTERARPLTRVDWPQRSKANRYTVASIVLFVALLFGEQGYSQTQDSAQLLGFLSSASPGSPAGRLEEFEKSLRSHGRDTGRTIVIKYRWTDGQNELLSTYANEFVKQDVKVIITHGNLATQAAANATKKIPIVCFTCGDLRLVKGVASLARPGANITGVSSVHPDTATKRMQFVKDLIPNVARIDVLYNIGNPVTKTELQATQEAANALKVLVNLVAVRNPSELRTALASRTRQDADALVILSDAMIHGRIPDIVEFSTKGRIPTITPWGSEFVRAGGLIGYGPDTKNLVHQAARQVDSILRGAKPSEIPIELPTTFELYINLKTAAAVGLKVPPLLYAQATEVIE